MTRNFVRFTCALLLALAALPAGAHPFHAAAGFASGFAHPFLGIDHLLAMVAVGIIAVQQGGSVWRLPLVFCVAMTAGVALASAGVATLSVEPLVAASVVVLGCLIASAHRIPFAYATPLIAVLAVLHGVAHGLEQPAGGTWMAVLGLLCATAILHCSGVFTAHALRMSVPLAGAPLVVTGAWLLGRALM